MSELRRLRQLEDENSWLEWLVADLSLDKHMLSEALRKKSKAAGHRELVAWLQGTFQVSWLRSLPLGTGISPMSGPIWVSGISITGARRPGRIAEASSSTSFGRANMWKMPLLNPLTGHCETSA